MKKLFLSLSLVAMCGLYSCETKDASGDASPAATEESADASADATSDEEVSSEEPASDSTAVVEKK